MYALFLKRAIDFSLSLLAMIILSPVFFVLIIMGVVVMRGNPFFVQPRPGKKDRNGKEIIFMLFKYRTMSDLKDQNGELLPDNVRLNSYGKFLRATSLDELPELLNIVKGDMAIVGPRPQLVRDMVFMTDEQRRRHDVRPGLTGLAQINGRNNITWERKLDYDLQYINSGIRLSSDFRILMKTCVKVFRREDIVREGTASDIDFGDWLLQNSTISHEEYEAKQRLAKDLLMGR